MDQTLSSPPPPPDPSPNTCDITDRSKECSQSYLSDAEVPLHSDISVDGDGEKIPENPDEIEPDKTYTQKKDQKDTFDYSQRVKLVKKYMGSKIPVATSPKINKKRKASDIGYFGSKDSEDRTTFTLPAARNFKSVLTDVSAEVQALKGSKQADRRTGPLPVGKFPHLSRPKSVFYELADDAWSWHDPVLDPELPRLLDQEPLKETDMYIKAAMFKEWQNVAHQSAAMMSHADWFGSASQEASESARKRLVSMHDSLQEFDEPDVTTDSIDLMSPATVVSALSPIIEHLDEAHQLLGSLATTLHHSATVQIQLMANLQLARRDYFLRQVPATVPPEAVSLLRQAPLGGPQLFGQDGMTKAMALKESHEQSYVNRQFLAQNSRTSQGRRGGGGGTQGVTRQQSQQQKQNIPQNSYGNTNRGNVQPRGRGRGQVSRGNPFRGGRPGGQNRGGGRGANRGRGGGRGGWQPRGRGGGN